MTSIFFLIGGALLGLLIAGIWAWVARSRQQLIQASSAQQFALERDFLSRQFKTESERSLDLQSQLAEVQGHYHTSAQQHSRLSAELAATGQRVTELQQERDDLQAQLKAAESACASLQVERGELQTRLSEAQQQAIEKLQLLTQAREQLSLQFRELATQILDEKTQKFTDQNQLNLNQLLAPLKQQLSDFKGKVEEVYVNEGKDRAALSEQVRQLKELNLSLGLDAQNLAQALRGDRKAQGNWGEIILDDVLEKAGLQEGTHYDRQGSLNSQDGERQIPDVVIHLPGKRHLVVDSKMTLPDYRAFANAEQEDERKEALRRHLISIRQHIKGLAEKKYQSLYGLKSLDFVVMFIPLEPAFMLAVTNDPELFQDAWDKNVLLVSPSTLLFVVRTVAYLWRQEDLSRNAQEISRCGADLYDKIVGFVEQMDELGERLEQASRSYDTARKRLLDGKGNVLGRAANLKKLGVKPSKALPEAWSPEAQEAEESPPASRPDSRLAAPSDPVATAPRTVPPPDLFGSDREQGTT